MRTKLKLNMIGGPFQHQLCSHPWKTSKHIEWVRAESANVSVHIDTEISLPTNRNKINYAWLVESTAIIPHVINHLQANIEEIEEKFQLIFTHDRRLLSLSPKMTWVIPPSAPWIKNPQIGPKTRMLSLIASSKVMCAGHLYRQEVIKKYHAYADHYGTGYRQVHNKADALQTYFYSINMENDNYPSIYTEKITDCFALGTIPIFWGAPDIAEYFNRDGIIMLEENFSLEELSMENYFSRFEAIKENYELSLAIPVVEDYIFEKYLYKLQ